jgi:hypothetical protein
MCPNLERFGSSQSLVHTATQEDEQRLTNQKTHGNALANTLLLIAWSITGPVISTPALAKPKTGTIP